MSLPAFLTSIYPADMAKRAAIVWKRCEGRRCTCGGPISRGTLDGEVIGYVCVDCPATFPPPPCAAAELADEWRANT